MEISDDAPYTHEDWPQPEKNKAAMITRLDRDIGRLLDAVQKLRLDSNTVIFFASDNGPHNEGGSKAAFFHSSGPLRGIKRDLYEGGIRVPMIVRWPGHIRAGQTNDAPWAFWDFLPTALDLAGAKDKPPAGLDGHSMLPTLLGQTQQPHEFFYWEFHEGGSKQAVRTGDWKAVQIFGKPLELYDLRTDPGETNNLAAAQPAVVARIQAYLKTARTDDPRYPLTDKPARRAAGESVN